MSFNKRRKKMQSEHEFINSANKDEKAKKTFSLRLNESELEAIREDARKNERSMQQQVKHIIKQYFNTLQVD
jgi:predicted DNA binding CopG/RHH family protein